VRFKGLPHWVHRSSVYTENRAVTASRGSFSDRFAQWDVHVYHLVEPLILRKVAPTRGTVGARVTLQGKGLAAATGVSFGSVKAHYKIVNDGKLRATVPKRARSGPIVVTTPLKQVATKTRFRIANDRKLVATVPKRAKSGPVLVTSALKQVKSRTSFRVLAGG